MNTEINDGDEVFERKYSVLELYTLGVRWASDYTEDTAIEEYLELHPEAKEVDVRAELGRELARLKAEWEKHLQDLEPSSAVEKD